MKENPFLRLRLKLNSPLILPRTIPLTEIEVILVAAYQEMEKAKTPGQHKSILRNIVVLELLFATGVWVSEFCALQCGDARWEEGVNIRYIQQLLGYSSIVITKNYTHVSGRKQRDILAEKHPRNKIHSMCYVIKDGYATDSAYPS